MAVVIFDLFGTLIEKKKYDYNAALKWLADTYFHCNFDSLLDLSLNVKEIYMNKRQVSNMETSFVEQLRIFENQLNTPLLEDYLTVETQFMQIFRDEYLIEGVAELLSFLYDKKCSVYLLTNSIFSGHSLKIYLNKFGIEKYFSKIYSSADIGYRKPSKEAFNFVLNDIGNIKMNEIYYVGDSFDKDYLGAFACNITPILISSNKEMTKGLVFTNLKSLLSYFKAIL